MAQKRFVDRGRPYDYEAWRSLYANTLTPGVYSGFDLSPSTTSASQVTIASGALVLPSGLVVVEDSPVTVQIGGVFPPSVATNYTIRTKHVEVAMGLIGGAAMTYLEEASLLTTQPTDGVILGWIRHPGGGVPLIQSYITNAPKYSPEDLTSDSIARIPIVESAPDLVSSLGAGISATSGFETNQVWRGFTNPSTAIDPATSLTPVATSWFQYPAYERPWQIKVRSIVPTGSQISVSVFDTAGVQITSGTIAPHSSWQVDTISVPTATGTFTSGSKATVKLESTVAQGTIVKIADITVDFWPYAFPQF